MINLTQYTVDKFVEKQQRRGVNVRWDGWTMVFFKRDKRAQRRVNGARLNDDWGYETKVAPNDKGLWVVDPRLMRACRGV